MISRWPAALPDPALPVGQVRIGGFGVRQPMRQWLVENQVDAVVDATHPFAAAMTERAARVCRDLGLPHVVVTSPPWDPVTPSRWRRGGSR